MNHPVTCGCPTCAASVPLKRPRYFPRQLITPAEMNLEQAYFRERLRLHNRMLHGWGTVCGALVCPVTDEDGETRPWCVTVKPGYLLGPCGDEIYIDKDVRVDLRRACVNGASGDPCMDPPSGDVRDPWCSDVYTRPEAGPLYVAVRYQEILTRPVPVQPVGCGCDETACEYSRWCDGYEICTLRECPESHHNPPDLGDLFRGPIPPCPPCPDSPWLVLAEVEVDADGNVLRIDNCSCRRLVMSLASAWWSCREGEEPDSSVSIEAIEIIDGRVAPGGEFTAEIVGGPFPVEAALALDEDLTLVDSAVMPEAIKAAITVSADATPGARGLAVIDAAGNVLVRVDDAFEIITGSSPSPTKKKVTKKKIKKKASKKKKTG